MQVAASCVCAALLYALEEPVYRLMGLSAEVAATARTFYALRLASVLPLLLTWALRLPALAPASVASPG